MSFDCSVLQLRAAAEPKSPRCAFLCLEEQVRCTRKLGLSRRVTAKSLSEVVPFCAYEKIGCCLQVTEKIWRPRRYYSETLDRFKSLCL